MPRLDGRAKLDGTEAFGADAPPPGALTLRAIRAPHPRAAFAFGDLAGWAAARPGVAAVLTAADIPGRNRFGVIPRFADQPALAETETRFDGEPVALVALEDPDEDLTDFPVAFTPLPAVAGPAAAEAENAPAVHPERPGNVLIEGRVRRGDAALALAASAHRVAADIATPFVEHAPIETEAGAAWLDGDTLVIRACTQAPYLDRDDTAAILALPPERVRIVPSAVGGGFGTKLDLSVQPLIGLAALATGRPVRMTFTRPESMRATTKRHPARITATLGCDADGAPHRPRLRGRLRHRRLRELGPDRRQPRAGARHRPLPRPGRRRDAPAPSTPTARSPAPSAASACRRPRSPPRP